MLGYRINVAPLDKTESMKVRDAAFRIAKNTPDDREKEMIEHFRRIRKSNKYIWKC